MNDPDTSPAGRPNEAQRRQAADWIVRQDAGLSASENAEFAQWLNESPLHRHAYEQRLRLWAQFDQSAPIPESAVRPARHPKWGRLAALGAAAAVVFGIFLLIPNNSTEKSGRRTLATVDSPQVYLRHTLPDNSVVELNQDTRLKVSYTPEERTIVLLEGGAHFHVAKDASRPFVVRAQGALIKAVGTAFSVQLDTQAVEVLVTEGLVQMDTEATPDPEVAALPEPRRTLHLEAGQRTRVAEHMRHDEIQVESLSQDRIAEALSWKRPVLEFVAQPLSQVVEAVNRYNETQLVIASPDLAKRTITATLEPNRLDDIVRLIEVGMGLKVERKGNTELLLKAGSPPEPGTTAP